MSLDPEILKKLNETFKAELEEQLTTITNGLLKIEKVAQGSNEYDFFVEEIFRSAHNVKGAARSLGITTIGEIAHQLEAIFSNVQKHKIKLSKEGFNVCLATIDKMHSAMNSFLNQTPLNFDIDELLHQLKILTDHSPLPEIDKTSVPIKSHASLQDRPKTDSIRVSIPQIDQLVALMEEFQIKKLALEDTISEVEILYKDLMHYKHYLEQLNRPSFAATKPDLAELFDILSSFKKYKQDLNVKIKDISQVSNELQEDIRFLRLIPASVFLQDLPRYVRDISQELNKEIVFEMIGEEVKIDKMVLEGIKNPLLHLLRNAIDHGIEDKLTRIQRNKPEAGHISLILQEQVDKVSIKLIDDGGGLDINRIKAKIVEKNLYPTDKLKKLSDYEIGQFIFKPGFSTKNEVTTISGRGVGLDIVKVNVEQLKGSVEFITSKNQGTTFQMQVPLSLASECGIIFKVNDVLFVLPISFVSKVITTNINHITRISTSEVIKVDSHSVPIFLCSELLGIKEDTNVVATNFHVIIIKKGEQQIGLIVDEVIGERNIVVKPLGEPLNHIHSVAGGTLSGSNQVMIVLKATELIEKALLSSPNDIHFRKEAIKIPAKKQILVVDDSITTRTLEKNILESKNFQVSVAVNGKEAWELLQKKSFALMITDVSMPIMDGFALTQRVKRDSKLKSMPVIIVTSLDSDAEKKQGLESGADAYIVKHDFESGALLEVINQLV